MTTFVIVHYQEITLKGKNRAWFIGALIRQIKAVLSDLDLITVRAVVGRLEITLASDSRWAEVRERLRRIPGIGHFAKATQVAATEEAVGEVVVAALGDLPPVPFRIKAHRADKRFPIESPAFERLVGAKVVERLGWPVDLKHPQLVVRVDLLLDKAYVFVERDAGPGGLPVGTGGKALCLLSGGIDSPVAAWRLIRRGVRVQTVHFHSYPVLNNSSQEKVRELARILATYQLKTRLYLVPLAAFQQQVLVSTPPPLRVVLYRRMMVRLAERIANRAHAGALVTGEVIGQVASQTLENLRAIDDASTLPILRPLIGMDKESITDEAKWLQTYATSILPDQDCCSLFVPRYPATRASLEAVREAESMIDLEGLASEALARIAIEEARFPGGMVKSNVFVAEETSR